MNKTTISLSILATMLCALIIFTSTSFVPASNGNGNGDNFGYDIFTTASQETTTKKTEPTTKKTKPSTKSLTIGRTKINKVTVKKTTVTVSLKKIKNVDGYVVKVGTSKKFSNVKTVTTKTEKAKIRKLKKTKKYYIKARAFKIVKKAKKYGTWSKVYIKKN